VKCNLIKKLSDITSFLNNKFDVTMIEPEKLSDSRFNIIINNIIKCELNKNKFLKYDELDILIFDIIRNTKSENYYKKAILSGALEKEELIRIIIEKKTGYIECSSQELYKELRLFQGVSQYDIENNTSVFWDYCTLLEKEKK
jgi:hypothetical protein